MVNLVDLALLGMFIVGVALMWLFWRKTGTAEMPRILGFIILWISLVGMSWRTLQAGVFSSGLLLAFLAFGIFVLSIWSALDVYKQMQHEKKARRREEERAAKLAKARSYYEGLSVEEQADMNEQARAWGAAQGIPNALGNVAVRYIASEVLEKSA